MPVSSQGHYGFHSFPVVDWFCIVVDLSYCCMQRPVRMCILDNIFNLYLINKTSLSALLWWADPIMIPPARFGVWHFWRCRIYFLLHIRINTNYMCRVCTETNHQLEWSKLSRGGLTSHFFNNMFIVNKNEIQYWCTIVSISRRFIYHV
jgi:hypothetical protein